MNAMKVNREFVEEKVCPICLGGDDEDTVNDDDASDSDEQHGIEAALVYGRCGHSCCLPCLKQLFAAPSNSSDSNILHRDALIRIPAQEDLLTVPTMGRCPICRGTICLLDLKKSSRPNGVTQYAVPRENAIGQTELAGMVFVKRKGKQGEESIHFPTPVGTSGDLPFVSFEKRMIPMLLDDGSTLTEKIAFFDPSSCCFHKESRTFHGTLRWDEMPAQSSSSSSSLLSSHNQNQAVSGGECGKRLFGSRAWEYILNFSSDYRYVARGIVIKRRDPCRLPDCSRMECKFPLDGDWIVDRDAAINNGHKWRISMVRVHGNLVFGVDGLIKPLGKIEFNAISNYPILSLIDERGEFKIKKEIGSLDPEWNRRMNPEGPAVGTSVRWQGILQESGELIWRRNTMTPMETPLEVVKLDTSEGLFYHRVDVGVDVDVDETAERPSYIPDTLWGNVFCQLMMVGMASYHFNEDGSAYISYEHERTSAWPNLDNGESIPPRISFVNTTFDEESRTFKGKIDWEGTHNTTWTSSRWWR
jgi:hypothetical protein